MSVKWITGLLIVVTIAATGCDAFLLAKAARDSIDKGQVQGLTSQDKFDFTLPDQIEGPFTDTQVLNCGILEGTYKGCHASFIMGRQRTTGKWEIIAAYVERDGKWSPLALQTGKP